MTLWRKQAVDYWSHPKILAAGKDGGIAFEAVLGLNAQLARDGVLHARDARPEALLAKATVLSLRALGRGLDRCVEAGLLERTADGGLRILGWDDEWRPRPQATRAIDQPEDVPVDATCVPCTRCGRIKVLDEYRQCPDCRDYDRSRRAARMPQEHRCGNRSGTGAETAAVPVRIAAALPHQTRSGSAVRNGYRSGKRCEDRGEEIRAEETRANDDDDAGISCLRESGDRGVSVAQDAREHTVSGVFGEHFEGETDPNVDRIVRGLARKVTGEKP